MAPTPEEPVGQQQEQQVVVQAAADPQPEPFSPSIFLDLPPTPPSSTGDDLLASSDDLVLPYITRMLMEDDIHDRFFYKYPDHPALLQAQQPFVDILSDAATTWQLDDDPVELELSQPEMLRSPAFPAVGVQEELHYSFTADDADMLNRAFLEGMEEAKRFLPVAVPTNNGLFNSKQLTQVNKKMGGGKNRRNVQDDVDAETSRNSKLMVAEPDHVAVDVLSSCLKDIESLSISMDGEVDKNTRRRKKKLQPVYEARDLHTLLLHCAQAVGMNDRQSATQLLGQIRKHSSPTGDANQRLAHCFAQGLEARLAGTGSQVYKSLVSRRTSVVEYLKAYQLYIDTCCFETMAFRFANLTICNATAGRKKVHIVDYGIDYGLQWPSLLNRFGNREGGPPELRITGIDLPQLGFRPSSRADETGRRLSKCASYFGVPYKFQSIVGKWETICVDDLDIKSDEYLIVNSLIPFGYMMDEGLTVDSPSPRDVVLNNIRKMRPDLFILCNVNASHNSPFFVTRFREALSYYSAIFDMMDTTTPRDNELRLLVERDLYGQCALNVVACEGLDRVDRPETYRQWQTRSHRAGLKQVPLDPCIINDVREKVKSLYHKDFVIDIDQHWLLEGWKGRILYAMSTWIANDST